jgi:hypothetical protein
MRRPANKKSLWLVLFIAIFILQAAILIHSPRDGSPLIGDAAEVHNIAWNLVHGHGYSVNWDDPAWRAAYIAHSRPSLFLNMILARTGSHPTMSRPPLMSLLVAAVIKIYPAHAFLGWRLIDAALFSLAACLLTAASAKALGNPAALIVITIVLLDPMRNKFVPGWWTEGMAFDFLAALIYLIALGRSQPAHRTILLSGILLGLLCLDRSFFIILLPFLALVLGEATVGRISAAIAILAIALVIQCPWWFRNLHLAHQMPLGTQGGFNLPDEYSDHAIEVRGGWDGDGMGYVWTHRPDATPEEIAGHLPPQIAIMRPDHPRAAAATYATMCESLDSEIAVAKLGTASGLAWIKSNPLKLPELFVMKIVTQISYDRWWIGSLSALAAIGLLLSRPNQFSLAMIAMVFIYMAGIGLTHAMPGRFLVPVLPPLYVLATAGILAIANRAGLLQSKD